jgi:hypothetical protein
MKQPTEAYRNAQLFESGIGYVLVARWRGAHEVELGVFLIDSHCLGVKDAFYTRLGQSEYQTNALERMIPAEDRMAISPATARKLVEAAVAYARGLGFAPHPDHKKACRVFGGIDPGDSTEEFVFGSEGKPLYVQGPHDSPAMVQRIMRQLQTRCGSDGFHYILRAEMADELGWGGAWRESIE